MTFSRSRLLMYSLLSCSLAGTGMMAQPKGRGGPAPRDAATNPGTYSTVNGTVSQLNYNRDAEVSGVLLNNNILVQLPPSATAQFANIIHSGDSLQVSGMSRTSPGGFQTVDGRDIKDKTSGKSFVVPEPGAAAPYSASGRIRQLNYGPDGTINGFLMDNGTMANIPPFGSGNPSSIRTGATVAVAGFARTTASGKTVVDVQSLSLNGQQLASAVPMDRRGPGAPAAPPRRPRDLRGAAQPPAPPVAPDAPPPPAPADRAAQPPPPPAPQP